MILGKLYEVQPFRNTIDTIQLQGRYLRQALEHSAASYNENYPDGGFLQVSGTQALQYS